MTFSTIYRPFYNHFFVSEALFNGKQKILGTCLNIYFLYVIQIILAVYRVFLLEYFYRVSLTLIKARDMKFCVTESKIF